MQVVVPASLIGLPTISLPAGFCENNLPFGIQLIAPAGNDAKLSEIALAIENALSNHEETKRAIPDII